MSDPFIGEIRIFAIQYNPYGWLPCDGRTLSVQQFTALFALLGTQYGGNGQNTFALPNLTNSLTTGIGMVPIGAGAGTGLTSYRMGQTAGAESVTITPNQTPVHNHNLIAKNANDTNTVSTPTPTSWISRNYPAPVSTNYSDVALTAGVALANTALGIADGKSQPHENRQPYLALNYYIATDGVFPGPE